MEMQSRKVLIVEDDMIISLVLERMVLKLGFRVVDKVTEGKKAIQAAMKYAPDLILMDIQLKDNIDGITAMQKIRRSLPVHVIYITGNSDRYNIERAKKTNFIDYLIKPVGMNDLKKSIYKAFENQPM